MPIYLETAYTDCLIEVMEPPILGYHQIWDHRITGPGQWMHVSHDWLTVVGWAVRRSTLRRLEDKPGICPIRQMENSAAVSDLINSFRRGEVSIENIADCQIGELAPVGERVETVADIERRCRRRRV